jgi:hypothetical protein
MFNKRRTDKLFSKERKKLISFYSAHDYKSCKLMAILSHLNLVHFLLTCSVNMYFKIIFISALDFLGHLILFMQIFIIIFWFNANFVPVTELPLNLTYGLRSCYFSHLTHSTGILNIASFQYLARFPFPRLLQGKHSNLSSCAALYLNSLRVAVRGRQAPA